MKKPLLLAILLSVITFFLLGCTGSGHNNDLQTLIKTDQEWALVCASNNVDKLVSFYDTAGFAVNGERIIKGHNALKEYWSGMMKDTSFLCTWKCDKAEISGNLAYTWGHWTVRYSNDSITRLNHGIYLATWKRQENGEWKVLIDKP